MERLNKEGLEFKESTKCFLLKQGVEIYFLSFIFALILAPFQMQKYND